MNYTPVDIALAWTNADTIIVAHSESYNYADVYSETCAGSGIFMVSATGGLVRPVAVGSAVCDGLFLDEGIAIDPSGNWLVYSARTLPNNSVLVKLMLRTGHADTLPIACHPYLEHPSVSPDGNAIATIGLCNRKQRDWGAYVLHSDGSGLRDLAEGVGFKETAPAWSNDGTQLLLDGDSGLVITNLKGALRTLATDSRVHFLSWSPDGQWVAYGSDSTIKISHPDGSNPRQVFRNAEHGTFARGWGPLPEGLVAGSLVWSPDSKSLAFSRQFDRGMSIWRLDLESGDVSRITAPDRQ